MHQSLKINWKNATMMDIDADAKPDILADLSSKSTVTRVPAGSMGLIIPVFCDRGVYGTWFAPNAVFFRACASWLRPTGHLVIHLPPASMWSRALLQQRVLRHSLSRLFVSRLPHAFDLDAESLITALEHLDKTIREQLITQLIRDYPLAKVALQWLNKQITTLESGAKKARSDSMDITDPQRRDAFAQSVEMHTRGKLKRVKSPLVKPGGDAVVFERIT